VRRRLTWAVFGVASCAAPALVATLLTSRSDEPVGAQILVPQEQNAELAVSKPPMSTVSVLLPLPSADTGTSPPAPASSQSRRPPVTPPQPAPTRTTIKPAGVDFQAENARIRHGNVESDHAGFTGSGFVDYHNVAGSSVEWTVTAFATTGTDVVFRFANGSSEARPMNIAVNGILVAAVAFPVTNGWEDWQTLTVHVNQLAGTGKIKATATTRNGGPNVDKITVA
jgi:hypothetical protein